MTLNMIYLIIGSMVGFLLKHEIDCRNFKKRAQDRTEKSIISTSIIGSNDSSTLDTVRELNMNLSRLQHKK